MADRALAGDATDHKLGSFDWLDSVPAVERPVHRSIAEIAGDFQNSCVPRSVRCRCAQEWGADFALTLVGHGDHSVAPSRATLVGPNSTRSLTADAQPHILELNQKFSRTRK